MTMDFMVVVEEVEVIMEEEEEGVEVIVVAAEEEEEAVIVAEAAVDAISHKESNIKQTSRCLILSTNSSMCHKMNGIEE